MCPDLHGYTQKGSNSGHGVRADPFFQLGDSCSIVGRVQPTVAMRSRGVVCTHLARTESLWVKSIWARSATVAGNFDSRAS